MALAELEDVRFSYPGEDARALDRLSLRIEAGETVAVVGPSGSGKTTLVRTLAGLVPHFHGGCFAGRAIVGGLDTRVTRPSELAGLVATVFQDPEDQVVMTRVANEVLFALENVGVPAAEMGARVEEALDAVGALHLAERRTSELSGGELQRVVLASALALRPELLLLDEPTSQLDPGGSDALLAWFGRTASAVVLSEQRTARALALADRVLFVERGRLLLDAPLVDATAWLEEHRPAYLPAPSRPALPPAEPADVALAVDDVSFSYGPFPVLDGVSLAVRRGEVVALEGPNGSGKTTLAKLAAGLLVPAAGTVERVGRACYLSQDPGRYLVCERVVDEVALGVAGDRRRALAALAAVGLEWAAERHPRDLSSGERERLGLAAVVAPEPDLLVLDEPTRGVDPVRKAELGDWLAEYAAGGRAVLVATHDRTFPAHRRVTLDSRESVVV